MTAQRLVLTGGYPDGVWTCAWCAAELNESEIIHRDDCQWIAGIAAAGRDRIIAPVLRVHRESGLSEHCVNCRFLWPCPTIQALESAGLLTEGETT